MNKKLINMSSQIRLYAEDGSPKYWTARAEDAWTNKYSSYKTNAADFDGIVIDVEGPLFNFNEANSRLISDALEGEPKDIPVRLDVNSPGGDVFAGIAMRSRLDRHEGPITAHILGLAASAAQYLTMAADEIHIARDAQIMIHRAQGFLLLMGDPDELSKQSSSFISGLKKNDEKIKRAIANRMGIPQSRVAQLMLDETWYDSEEAVDAGLADYILPRKDDMEEENAMDSNKENMVYNNGVIVVTNDQKKEVNAGVRQARVRQAYEDAVALL